MCFNSHNIVHTKLALINSVMLSDILLKNISQQKRHIFRRACNTYYLERHRMAPVFLPPKIWTSTTLLSVTLERVRLFGGLQWHNVHTKFRENRPIKPTFSPVSTKNNILLHSYIITRNCGVAIPFLNSRCSYSRHVGSNDSRILNSDMTFTSRGMLFF
jgi:hypothetical protein